MATAIAGRVHVDPCRTVGQNDGPGMLTRLMRRHDATEQWRGGGAFLVQVGAVHGRLQGGGLRIVADVRLDDRDVLASAIGCDAALSDAALVLAAYQKWGIDGVGRLSGDFAFAIWDETDRTLVCARDLFGIAPFYYRHDGTGLAFSSQLSAVWQPGDQLDADNIAAYLHGFADSVDETAFLPVRRLPAGCWLRWRAGKCTTGRHSALAAETLPVAENYALGLRERFLAAVDARSGKTPGLGAMLSGGLDSSSIVSAVAARGHSGLQTFSFRYQQASPYDEADYASTVIEKYPATPHHIPLDDLAPLDGWVELARGPTDLLFAPGLPKIHRLLVAARQSGVRVVLDGHGGDEVISHGFGRLNELARQRRWRTLYRELRGLSALTDQSTPRMFLTYFTRQGLSARLRKALVERRPSRGMRGRSLLNRDLVLATDVEARAEAWQEAYRRASRREDTLHLWNVTSPAVARGFESLRVAADRAGVELRFPFYDRRVVAYALAVPETEKLKNGFTRYVMREAMEGILPDKVRWRRTKIDFGGELADGIAQHHGSWLRDVLSTGSGLEDYVDLAAARALLGRLQDNPRSVGGTDVFSLWRVAFLAIWLRELAEMSSHAREQVLA